MSPPTRGVVHVDERRATATIRVPDAYAGRLLIATVPARGRHRDGDAWVVYGSHLHRLYGALRAAGYTLQQRPR